MKFDGIYVKIAVRFTYSKEVIVEESSELNLIQAKIKLGELEITKLKIQLEIAQLHHQFKLKELNIRDVIHQREINFNINHHKRKFDIECGKLDEYTALEKLRLKMREKEIELNQQNSPSSGISNSHSELLNKLSEARTYYSKAKSDYSFKNYKQALFNFSYAKDIYQDIYSKKYTPEEKNEVRFGKIQKRLSKLTKEGKYSRSSFEKRAHSQTP